MTSPRPFGLFI